MARSAQAAPTTAAATPTDGRAPLDAQCAEPAAASTTRPGGSVDDYHWRCWQAAHQAAQRAAHHFCRNVTTVRFEPGEATWATPTTYAVSSHSPTLARWSSLTRYGCHYVPPTVDSGDSNIVRGGCYPFQRSKCSQNPVYTSRSSDGTPNGWLLQAAVPMPSAVHTSTQGGG